MKSIKVASRYAKALFELSIEQKKIEEVKNDFESILSVVNSNKDFNALLKSPVIAAEKKVAVFKEIFGSNLSALTFTFFDLLALKRREDFLTEIGDHFIKIYKEFKSIETVYLTTVNKVDADSKAALLAFVQKIVSDPKKQIELVEQIDASLIGGFVVSIKDARYDASLGRTLNLLSRDFADNQYIKSN